MRAFSIALVLTFVPGSAFAAPIGTIDFAKIDLGLSGQRVEPGFVGVGANSASAVLPATSLTSSAATGSVNFTIAIDDGSGGTVDWRDRGNSTSTDPLVQVGEDHLKHNAGLIEVTLAGIPTGTYDVKSYHIDGLFGAGVGLSDDIQVLISDAVGTLVNPGVSADGTLGGPDVNALTEAAVEGSSMMFQVVSDGSPITLLFDGTAGTGAQTPLSGLEISLLVPEPASIAVWSVIGVALLGLGCFRRRRR